MIIGKNLTTWNFSILMFFNKSPKLRFNCGNCGSLNKTRISLNLLKINKPYVICNYCGEVNNTLLRLTNKKEVLKINKN